MSYLGCVSDPKGRGWQKRPILSRLGSVARKTALRFDGNYTPDEHIEMAEQRLRILTRTYGVDGGPTAKGRADLAERLEHADRWTEARVLREEVLDARRRNLGADHQETLSAELWLARNLSRDGMHEQALALATHARDGAVDDEHRQGAERMVAYIEEAGGLRPE